MASKGVSDDMLPVLCINISQSYLACLGLEYICNHHDKQYYKE